MTEAPLAGIRVVDMAWMWAGPYCSLQLAELGAEVIRLETPDRPDMNRIVPPYPDNIPGLNRGGSFNQWNQAKKSLALDLKAPEAVELVLDLVEKSDVFVENYAVGIVERLGLGYDALKERNPGLIMISLTGYGTTGPYRDQVAFGTSLTMISGLASLTGYEGGGPTTVGISYADPNAGLHGAFAVQAALWARETSGVGQHIDLSQWESLLSVMPEGILPHAMRGEQLPRMGNRDIQMSPHGIYPASGEDRWVAISVRDDEEWRRLAAIIGQDLATDPRFATAQLRKQHEDELESLIAEWTASRDRWSIADDLQAAGIPVAPVFDTKDVAEDPHMNERGFFVELPHPEVGVQKHAGIPWKLHDTPVAITKPAPCIGEDNEYVVVELLGRDRAEYERLLADRVLLTEPTAP